jgi:hypothetical protein
MDYKVSLQERGMNEIANSLDSALRAFEATEANLDKLDRLWQQLRTHIPDGIAFGSNPEYEELLRHFDEVASGLPAIDGWRIGARPLELDDIGRVRFDAAEIGEIEAKISIENHIYELDSLLPAYRFRLNRKRRHVVRAVLEKKIESVNQVLKGLALLLADASEQTTKVEDHRFERLRQEVREIDTLLGSSVKRPLRWAELNRHLSFGLYSDLGDILNHDWPAIEGQLSGLLFGENEPLPVGVEDLAEIVIPDSNISVPTKLNWSALDPEEFERLVFTLIAPEPGYENVQWLMQTNAPDRGRDLSATRVATDALLGTFRSRVIVQCRHWLKRSIAVADVANLKEQVTLWEPPRVDICIIATSGRFSSDAVALIEKQNQSDRALRIEMWPESHLERLLAGRPGLIAQFGLR